VKITKPFWLGKCPVSQKEFSFVMGFNPSTYAATGTKKTAVHGGDTSRYPVETVSWEDAVEFCRQLSALPEEVEAWRTYRLPTEAEWEYACRAGTTTRWWCGNDEAGLEGAAWYDKNADGIPHPLGEKQSNAWHLCDMHGNVWQWCADWFSADYYRQSAPNDPAGPPTGSLRALRGGDFSSGAWKCRSASRDGSAIASRGERHGFRVVLDRKAQ
jgi:formylglycine-generating enzyme required for sulfatase activity